MWLFFHDASLFRVLKRWWKMSFINKYVFGLYNKWYSLITSLAVDRPNCTGKIPYFAWEIQIQSRNQGHRDWGAYSFDAHHTWSQYNWNIDVQHFALNSLSVYLVNLSNFRYKKFMSCHLLKRKCWLPKLRWACDLSGDLWHGVRNNYT